MWSLRRDGEPGRARPRVRGRGGPVGRGRPQHPRQPAGAAARIGPTTTWPRRSRRRSSSPGHRARTKEAEPRRQLRLLTWGLVPSWSKDPKGGARMINARVESVADKPAFARALASRRCLVPARGWYEWQVVPDGASTPRASRASSRSSPSGSTARAWRWPGLYEFWRDPGVRRPRRPAGLADDLHRRHRTRRAGAGPHPRPSAPRPRARRVGHLARPGGRRRRRPAPAAAAPRGALHRAAGLPGREQQPVERPAPARPRAARGARRGRRPDDGRGGRRVTERLVDTPEGPARTTTTEPAAAPVGTLVLGHGAGGLRWTLDVLAVRDTMVAAGWQVVLVDQPWRVAGKKVGPRPATLDTAWVPVLADVDAAPPGRAARRRGPQRRGAGGVPHGRGRGRRRRRVPVLPAPPPRAPAAVARGRAGPSRGPRAARARRPGHAPTPSARPAEVEAVLPPHATLDVVPGPHSLGRVADRVAALVLARLSPGE